MNSRFGRFVIPFYSSISCLLASSAAGQGPVYRLYSDEPSSPSLCDAVNLARDTAGVFEATGELDLLDGTVIPFSEVDEDGVVSVDRIPAGFIRFADDAEGFRKLWWLWFDGAVVDFNPVTERYGPSNFLPLDFGNVPCDVCDVIDDVAVCGCEGLSGCCVDNADCSDGNECTTDLCEAFGCVYENRDAICDDLDDCTEDDICVAGVCSGVVIEDCEVDSGGPGSGGGGAGPGLTFTFCGSGASLAMWMTAFGLLTTKTRRRWAE